MLAKVGPKWGSTLHATFYRGESRTAATSKMERFIKHSKALHLGCCSSPRSASNLMKILYINVILKYRQ